MMTTSDDGSQINLLAAPFGNMASPKHKAIDAVTVAVRADTSGDYDGALAAYERGIALFNDLLSTMTTDDSLAFRDAVRERVKGYSARCRELRQVLDDLAIDSEANDVAASQRSSEAAAVVTEAVRADSAGNYVIAIGAYERGIALFEAILAAPVGLHASAFCDAVRLRVAGYAQRCVELRAVLAGATAVAAAPSAAPSAPEPAVAYPDASALGSSGSTTAAFVADAPPAVPDAPASAAYPDASALGSSSSGSTTAVPAAATAASAASAASAAPPISATEKTALKAKLRAWALGSLSRYDEGEDEYREQRDAKHGDRDGYMLFLQAAALESYKQKTGEVLEYSDEDGDEDTSSGVAQTIRATNETMAMQRAQLKSDMASINTWMEGVTTVLTRTPEERAARAEERVRRKDELRQARVLARAAAEIERARTSAP